VRGFDEHCLANWSFNIFTYVLAPLANLILLCYACFISDWHQLPTNLQFILTWQGLWRLSIWKNSIHLSLYLYSIFSITHTLTLHTSSWKSVILSPRLKICSLLKLKMYTTAPQHIPSVRKHNRTWALLRHGVEAIQLLDNSELLQRLKITKPFQLVSLTLNHKHKAD
jgi:hypothetical protein